MSEVIQKIIPILLFILFGYMMRVKGYLSRETMDGLKKFVLEFVVASIIFLAFLDMKFKAEYLAAVFAII